MLIVCVFVFVSLHLEGKRSRREHERNKVAVRDFLMHALPLAALHT